MEGWRSFGARSRSSEREESGHGDDGWSARTPVRRAAVLGLHGFAVVRGRGTEWIALEPSRPSEEKSGARTTRIAGMNDTWSGSPAFRHRYGRGRAQCRAGVPLFTRLTIFDSLKLQISYGNMKFGQNKSCRGKDDLQLLFWAKVDLELESMIKMRLKTAKKMFTKRT